MTNSIKSLVDVDGNEKIIWNSEVGQLEIIEGKTKQNLLLTSRPYFQVKSILLSPIKNLLALIGQNGVTIVEMPRQWNRNRLKGEKESQIYCKTFNINERLFTCEKRLRIAHVDWHPQVTETKQILCILTNDNRLRFHDVLEDLEIQVINLRIKYTSDNDNDEYGEEDGFQDKTLCLGISTMNLGETGICFDFGPPMVVQKPDVIWPIYILMGSGEILLVYTNVQNPIFAEHIIGPLQILPEAEDQYASDACSIIVLDSSPPLLAIAKPSGTIVHCFAFVNDKSSLPTQTLYVYESIELAKDLIENDDEPYSQHPMKLYKDPTSEIRYFCVHQNGVHTVVLPILETLQQPDCDIEPEKESFSEFIICTRTTTPSDANTLENCDDSSTPRGLCVEVRLENIVLLVLMPSNELITHRISPATTLINRKRFPRHSLNISRDRSISEQEILNVSQIDSSRGNFEEQVQQILKRSTNVPMLKLSENLEHSDQMNELIKRTLNTFRREYIKKFNLAAEAIKKKATILEKDMQNQKVEYKKICKEKEDVYISTIALGTKAGLACDKQKELLSRIDRVLSAVAYGHPDLSEAESKLRRELTNLNDKVKFYRDSLDSIVAKHKYHMSQKDPSYQRDSDLLLSQTQLNKIKETLTKQSSDIAELKRAIKSSSGQTIAKC